MKRVLSLLLVLVMMLSLAACGECDHDWEKATCEDPKTCSKCGETKGEPEEEHDWEEDDDGVMVCSWCGEEKDEDEDEDEDAGESGSEQVPTAPTPAGISWSCTAIAGLTYYIPEGIPVLESYDDYILYDNGDMQIIVICGPLDGMATDANGFAEMYVDEMSGSYESTEMGKANGTPYTLSTVTEGVYEICGYYVYNDYGWMIVTYISDLDAYGDIAIHCATTGQLDENYVDENLLPDDVETVEETFTVHAYTPLAWGYPACWAWSNSTGENVFDAWPGETMTWNGDHYTIEIPIWAEYVIISGVDGAIQTADQPVEPGCDVWFVVTQDGSYYDVFFSEPSAEDLSANGY